MTVEGKSVKTDLKIHEMSFDDFVEAADYAVIEDAYRRSARSISSDLATTYSEHLAREADSGELEEDALIEAHTTIAAIGLVDDIKEQVESEAEKLAKQWLNKYRVQIKSLSDERREVYRQIREMSTDPLDVDLARPNTWMQPTTVREADGSEVDLPCFERHLLCDEGGQFPEAFGSSWEEKVLLAELEGTSKNPCSEP